MFQPPGNKYLINYTDRKKTRKQTIIVQATRQKLENTRKESRRMREDPASEEERAVEALLPLKHNILRGINVIIENKYSDGQ